MHTKDPEEFSPERMISKGASKYVPAIEAPPLTREMLRTAYLLSLETEEARPLRVTLVITDQAKGVGTLPGQCVFNPARPADVRTIRKIAHATDPHRTCLYVQANPETGAPQLAGMAFRPEPHDDSYHADRIAVVDVIGPGRIRMQLGGSTVLFDRSAYREPNGERVLESVIASHANINMVRRLTEGPSLGPELLPLGNAVLPRDPLLWPKHGDSFVEAIRRWAKFAMVWNLTFLAREVSDRGRGGTIVITPDAPLSSPGDDNPIEDGLVLQQHVRLSKADPWNCGLLDWIALRAHIELAGKGVTVLADLGNKSAEELQKWIRDIGKVRLERAGGKWDRESSAIADLTMVDGAVILDPTHQPVMFGAKFHRTSIHDLPPEAQAYVKDRGNRHRSAAHAAWRLKAIALVVSQDGGVTLFDATGSELSARALIM